jgi:hypothetical protein
MNWPAATPAVKVRRVHAATDRRPPMLRTVLGPAFALALALPLSARAQDGPPRTSLNWFASFDQDGDGTVTPDEISAAGSSEFARIDRDESGGITLDEYLADIAAEDADNEDVVRQTRNRFAVLDRRGDGNGTASQAEFIQFSNFVLQVADQNGDLDGRMSRQEFIDSITPAAP